MIGLEVTAGIQGVKLGALVMIKDHTHRDKEIESERGRERAGRMLGFLVLDVENTCMT